MPITLARARGFTLIELLVVIAIISLLSTVVLASLNSAREKARNAAYTSQIKQYQSALALYYLNNGGTYPGPVDTWMCIGSGYSDGNCWTGGNATYSEAHATPTALRAALAPYIDSTIVPGSRTATYGSMYRRTSTGYLMILMLDGTNQTCPIGTRATAAHGSQTRCDIVVE